MLEIPKDAKETVMGMEMRRKEMRGMMMKEWYGPREMGRPLVLARRMCRRVMVEMMMRVVWRRVVESQRRIVRPALVATFTLTDRVPSEETDVSVVLRYSTRA